MTAHRIHAGTQHPRATHHIRSLSKICAGGRYVVRRICLECLPILIAANKDGWASNAGDVASFPCCIRSTEGGGGAPCRELPSNGTLSVTRLKALVPLLAEPFAPIVTKAMQQWEEALANAARYCCLLQADPTLENKAVHIAESNGWKVALDDILIIRQEVPICPGCRNAQCAPGEVDKFTSCCALFCFHPTCPVFKHCNGFCLFCGDEVDCVRLPTPKCPAPPDYATTELLHMPCRIWGCRSPPVCLFLCASQEIRRAYFREHGRSMTSGRDELHRHVINCQYHPYKVHNVSPPPHSFYVREPPLLKRSLRELAARKLADMLRDMTSQEFERFTGECALGHPAQRCSSVSLARNDLLPYLALLTNRPSHCRTTAFWRDAKGGIVGQFGDDGPGDERFVDSGISTENARRVAASSRAGSPELEDVDIGPLPDAIASLAEDAPYAAVEACLDMPYLQVFRKLHAEAQGQRLRATAKAVAAALFSCEWNPVEAMSILASPAPPDQAAAAAALALDSLSLESELQNLPSNADVGRLARTCAEHMAAQPIQAGSRHLGFHEVQRRLQLLVDMEWCISLAMSDPAIC